MGFSVGSDVRKSYVSSCGPGMDARGFNGLFCKFSAGRYSRYQAINDIIKPGLQSTNVTSILETGLLNRRDGKRSDSIAVFLFSNERSFCWEATYTDIYAKNKICRSAVISKVMQLGRLRNKHEGGMRRFGLAFRLEPASLDPAGV